MLQREKLQNFLISKEDQIFIFINMFQIKNL